MKHDYLIEFAWKLSSFLFYHCYAEFAEGGTYHYELRQQLESMFSDDLLVRWYVRMHSKFVGILSSCSYAAH
jgi:hypothetical protein